MNSSSEKQPERLQPMSTRADRVVDLRGAELAFWESLVHETTKPLPELWVVDAELPTCEAAVCAYLFIGRGISGES